jgi:hypothetical protein
MPLVAGTVRARRIHNARRGDRSVRSNREPYVVLDT